jgi:uncharacterized protein (DUF433 family)
MNNATVLIIDAIISDPDIRSGRPIIAGTSLRVQDIAVGYLYKGYSIDDLLRYYPQVNHAQVHAALSYYYDHQKEIDAHIEEDDQFYQQAKAEELSKLNRVRELATDLDLKSADGQHKARVLLKEYHLPEYLIYSLQPNPMTDEARKWADERIAELQAGGDVS